MYAKHCRKRQEQNKGSCYGGLFKLSDRKHDNQQGSAETHDVPGKVSQDERGSEAGGGGLQRGASGEGRAEG